MSDPISCSFCYKDKKPKEEKIFISGENNYICEECIEKCANLIKNIKDKKKNKKNPIIKTPRLIKEFLDQYVIGQDRAKEVIAIAVYNHYKRIEYAINDDDLEKSNVLLCGPSGTGKSCLVRSVAKMLNVPFVVFDATSLTEAGYVGDDVESIISRLVQAADGDIKKAETGIVFIDEIDKKQKHNDNNVSKDSTGEGVQQALLKLLEGTEIMIPNGNRRGPNVEMIKINTKNILFILGGAFVGLDKIMEESTSIGFGATVDKKKTNDTIESEHLIKFGLIPELIGRIPIIAILNELTENQLIKILTEPKNSLVKQYTKMFAIDEVALEFEDEALYEIAKIAMLRKTNARGLRNVIESKLHKIQYNLPDLRDQGIETIIITKSTIINGVEPLFVYKTNEEMMVV